MTHDVMDQLVAFGSYADSSAPALTLDEVQSRSMATPEASVPALRTARGWAIAAGVALAVLVVVGGLSVLLGGSDGSFPPAEAPAVAPSTSTPIQGGESGAPHQTVWLSHATAFYLTAAPPVLPPVPGTYEVTVQGFGAEDQTNVWLTECPGAHGDVDPATWTGPAGDVVAMCQLGDDPMFATGDFNDGEFVTTMEVEVTDQTIADGGLVISAGDIWLPVAANVRIRVSDFSATAWERSYEGYNMRSLTRVISYWAPFISTFNTTYESHASCEEAYRTAQTADTNLRQSLGEWDDEARDKPGFSYDTAVAELVASQQWLWDHTCPERGSFVSFG